MSKSGPVLSFSSQIFNSQLTHDLIWYDSYDAE